MALEGNELFSAQEAEAEWLRKQKQVATECPKMSADARKLYDILCNLPSHEAIAIAANVIRDGLRVRDKPTREGWCLVATNITGGTPIYVRTARHPSDPTRFDGPWEYKLAGGTVWHPLLRPVVELPTWEECNR